MYTQIGNSEKLKNRTITSQKSPSATGQCFQLVDNRAAFTRGRCIQLMSENNIKSQGYLRRGPDAVQLAGGAWPIRFRHAVMIVLGAAVWGAISGVMEVILEKGIHNISQEALEAAWKGALTNGLGAIGGTLTAFLVNKLWQCCCCATEEAAPAATLADLHDAAGGGNAEALSA